MIDARLVDKAVEAPEIVDLIDSSWREYVCSLKDNVYRVPFGGEYEAVIRNDSILVEGYSGHLLIDKVFYGGRTYLLKEPVRHFPFRIYGVYDRKGCFKDFVARPEIGFHYMGMSDDGHSICTGDIEHADLNSISALRSVAERIVASFRFVNMESLGETFLPDGYSRLKSVFADKESNLKTKFERLMSEKLIEEFL